MAEVLQLAYNGGYGTEAFPMIWKNIQYDRIAARAQAMQASNQQQAQQTQQRQQAAAAASQVVASGTHGGNGLTNEVDVSQTNMTPREAIERALDQLGIA